MQSLPLSHAGEFVLLAAERTVTVTREEHHQDVLAGRIGPAIAELRPCTIAAGKHAGQDGLEVLLDGRRVGELTRLMAQRYRPLVDEIRARGNRAGCEAVLRDDTRGVQVELRLPSAAERSATEPPTEPLPIPARGGASRWPGRSGGCAVPRRSSAAQALARVDPGRPGRAGSLRRPGSADDGPTTVPPPARGHGCGRRSPGARLGPRQRLAGRGAGRQLVGAAVCRGGTGGARCGRAESRDDERGAGRRAGRTSGAFDGAGPTARTGNVEAHDVQAHDLQARTPRRTCSTEARAGCGRARLELPSQLQPVPSGRPRPRLR